LICGDALDEVEFLDVHIVIIVGIGTGAGDEQGPITSFLFSCL
jgi:hypothetical protein